MLDQINILFFLMNESFIFYGCDEFKNELLVFTNNKAMRGKYIYIKKKVKIFKKN